MDYKELYEKAQKDLENIRVQKAQVQVKIKTLVEELDLDPEQDLVPQVEELKKQYEEKQKQVKVELDKLTEELKKYE